MFLRRSTGMIIDINKQCENDENIDIGELQKETIESLKEYIGKLSPKLKEMVIELRTNIQDDTWEYLRMMIDGFNWVIEAYNGTSSIINATGEIDENAIQKTVDELGKAYIYMDAERVANSIEDGVIPFLALIEKNV